MRIQYPKLRNMTHFLSEWLSSVAWSTAAQLMILFCFSFPVVFLADQGFPSVTQHTVSVESSSSLLLHSIET